MSLIVEDGTGKSDAESYASVLEADARHLSLGNSSWTDLTETEKEQALRKGTNYLSQKYRSSIIGGRVDSTQNLDFPRYGMVVDEFLLDSDFVPFEFKYACIDLALKSVDGDLFADRERGILREVIGPIDTTYDPASSDIVKYSAIEGMLTPFLSSKGNAFRLVRA